MYIYIYFLLKVKIWKSVFKTLQLFSLVLCLGYETRVESFFSSTITLSFPTALLFAKVHHSLPQEVRRGSGGQSLGLINRFLMSNLCLGPHWLGKVSGATCGPGRRPGLCEGDRSCALHWVFIFDPKKPQRSLWYCHTCQPPELWLQKTHETKT